MTIRTMKIEDYDSVYSLWLSTPGMGLNDIDDSKEGISQYLKRNPNTCFVAEHNHQIIGVIISGHDGRRGIIYHTAVAENMQRNGIGKALVHTALNALEKEGVHKVFLVVFEKNAKGNSFWEKQGFEMRNDLIYRNKALSALQRIDT
ncbi:MAG: GNAT family N-acetyltransferase [Eubacteriales bacterium]|nr:GNAT family N-acetyltransferase [Eubacteriales bacterium]